MRIDIQQLKFIDPLLREIAVWIEANTRMEFTLTSLYRRIGDSGVHGTMPLRAIDLSCTDEHIGNRVAEIINEKYQYDRRRPHKKCAIFHDTGLGPHIHLQVHPNTQRKG